jgi:hypothetical protein
MRIDPRCYSEPCSPGRRLGRVEGGGEEVEAVDHGDAQRAGKPTSAAKIRPAHRDPLATRRVSVARQANALSSRSSMPSGYSSRQPATSSSGPLTSAACDHRPDRGGPNRREHAQQRPRADEDPRLEADDRSTSPCHSATARAVARTVAHIQRARVPGPPKGGVWNKDIFTRVSSVPQSGRPLRHTGASTS